MKDLVKEDYGDLATLEILGKNLKNKFTVEQLLNPNLKNKEGESNLEVRKRMLDFLNKMLDQYQGKRIAVVSHGAAIKFLLQNWCIYNFNVDAFFYQNHFLCEQNLESPSVIKMIFDGDKMESIEKIEYEKS